MLKQFGPFVRKKISRALEEVEEAYGVQGEGKVINPMATIFMILGYNWEVDNKSAYIDPMDCALGVTLDRIFCQRVLFKIGWPNEIHSIKTTNIAVLGICLNY